MSKTSGSIKMIGNWRKDMEMSLGWALNTTYKIGGRSIAQACKHAIILMTKSVASARTKLTKQSKKNRTIERDSMKRPYLSKYNQNKAVTRWYLPNKKQNPAKYAEVLAKLRPIGNQGLARRSWLWGLKGLRTAKMSSKPMGGIATMRRLLTKDVGGFILTNRLKYLRKIMAPGWQKTVERSATNKIMKQAENKLKSKWERELKKFGTTKARARQPDLGKYFLREAA